MSSRRLIEELAGLDDGGGDEARVLRRRAARARRRAPATARAGRGSVADDPGRGRQGRPDARRRRRDRSLPPAPRARAGRDPPRRAPGTDELDMGEQLLDELQDSVIQMRTLPLSTITASFPRAIRDLATEEKKKVELSVSGDETQLDRVILTGISETIVHVLRNAVAHGIETPKERKAAKKDPTGRVELRAEPRGRMVAIQVIDDGRGVSPELAARAEKEGSLAEILAETGFSTAERGHRRRRPRRRPGRGQATRRGPRRRPGSAERAGRRDRGDAAAAGHPGADEGPALRARRPPLRAADDERRPGRLGRRHDLARKSPRPGSRGRGRCRSPTWRG